MLRHQSSLAETITTSAAQTAPSGKPLMCTMGLPSVQVSGMSTATKDFESLKRNKRFLLSVELVESNEFNLTNMMGDLKQKAGSSLCETDGAL